ncbi:MAG: hypothetical protein R3F14_43700 [Polyangiaceae bacterium]
MSEREPDGGARDTGGDGESEARMDASRAGGLPPDSFRLAPAGRRTGGLVLMIVGLVAPVFAWSFLTQVPPDAAPFIVFLAGVGLCVLGVGYGVFFGGQVLYRLEIDRSGAKLSCNDGTSAVLPLPVLAGARVQTMEMQRRSGSSTLGSSSSVSYRYMVYLEKKDGGVFDLGEQKDEEAANRLAEAIRAALSRHAADAVTVGQDADAILAECRVAKASREEARAEGDYRTAAQRGDLAVRWSLRPRHHEVIAPLVVLSGVGTGVYGLRMQWASTGLTIFGGIVGAMALLMVVSLVRKLSVFMELRVGRTALRVAELRGGRRVEKESVPLADITGVDFSFQKEAVGGALQFRLHGAKMPKLPDGSEPALTEGTRLARKLYALHRNTVTVPLGRLPFGDRVRVDLALSAEIGERTEREETGL